MTRREAVRVTLFSRGVLIGSDRAVPCAIVDISAAGAKLTIAQELPAPPLQLRFELGDGSLEFPVDVRRSMPGGAFAVEFPRPHSEQMHRLIAAAQRHALAQGQVNVRDRRRRRSPRIPPADASEQPDGAA
jgi:hypothetical protein